MSRQQKISQLKENIRKLNEIADKLDKHERNKSKIDILSSAYSIIIDSLNICGGFGIVLNGVALGFDFLSLENYEYDPEAERLKKEAEDMLGKEIEEDEDTLVDKAQEIIDKKRFDYDYCLGWFGRFKKWLSDKVKTACQTVVKKIKSVAPRLKWISGMTSMISAYGSLAYDFVSLIKSGKELYDGSEIASKIRLEIKNQEKLLKELEVENFLGTDHLLQLYGDLPQMFQDFRLKKFFYQNRKLILYQTIFQTPDNL